MKKASDYSPTNPQESSAGNNWRKDAEAVLIRYCNVFSPFLIEKAKGTYLYSVEGKATTEAAIDTRWHGDIYAVLGDPNGSGGWVTRYYYNPGVLWMWIGAALMAFAGIISLTDRRLRIGAPAKPKKIPVAATVPAE